MLTLMLTLTNVSKIRACMHFDDFGYDFVHNRMTQKRLPARIFRTLVCLDLHTNVSKKRAGRHFDDFGYEFVHNPMIQKRLPARFLNILGMRSFASQCLKNVCRQAF